jgi:uncharacterized protein
MSEEPVAVSEETLSAQTTPEPDQAEKRRRWFELCLVLLVAFGGAILSGVVSLRHGPVTNSYGQVYWIYAVSQELTILLLLGYVLSRRKMRIRDLGLRWSIRDVALGIGLFALALWAYVLGFLVIGLVAHTLSPSPHAFHTSRQVFGHPSWLAIPSFLVNPFFEELTVRAYLMTEIKALTGSWTLALVASVAVQTAYHLYYGWWGALAFSLEFLVLSIFYASTRRATPLVIAHGLHDLLGFALMR